MLLKKKPLANILTMLMVNQSALIDLEMVMTTDFRLSIHFLKYGLPNLDIHQLLKEKNQNHPQTHQTHMLNGLLDQMTFHAWMVFLGNQTAEVVLSLKSATMVSKSRILMENLSASELDLAQDLNQPHSYQKLVKTWPGEVHHHLMEVLILSKAHAIDYLFDNNF